MLITLFMDYPTNIICLEKPGITTLIQELVDNTELTREQIMASLAESLAFALLLVEDDEAWEQLLELMEPRELGDDGEVLPSETTIVSAQAKNDVRTGIENLITEMKENFKEQYDLAIATAEEAKALYTFITASTAALEVDPEIEALLAEDDITEDEKDGTSSAVRPDCVSGSQEDS